MVPGAEKRTQKAEETKTSGGDQRQRRSPRAGRASGRGEGGPCGPSLPYLLASVGAAATHVCPVWLRLPGVMGGREPSLGHLLGAGQLPPAELLICLLVHYQQPGLPLHSLDPLHHLGRMGDRSGSVAHIPGSTWAMAPLWAGPGVQAGGWSAWAAGRTERPAGPAPHPQTPAAPSLCTQAPDTEVQAARASGSSQSLALSPGSSPAGLGRGCRVGQLGKSCLEVTKMVHSGASGFQSAC